MKKYILLVLISTSSFSQEIINQKDKDSLIKTLNLDEVTVNAIKANESVVKRAIPHSDEAKAKNDKSIKLLNL